VFEMREVRLQFFGAPGMFVCHAAILPARRREVETMKAKSGWWPERCWRSFQTNGSATIFAGLSPSAVCNVSSLPI
jgi:hypothetical protein